MCYFIIKFNNPYKSIRDKDKVVILLNGKHKFISLTK
jgi:hypothetical protein